MSNLTFDEQEDDLWTCTSAQLGPEYETIRLTLSSVAEPDQDYIDRALSVLKSIDDLSLKAAEQILENYSYEHFKNLGTDEGLLLKDETPQAMRKVAKLKEVWFNEPECQEFEMSFSVPWDNHHSFDVEFEDGEAICCSVNG